MGLVTNGYDEAIVVMMNAVTEKRSWPRKNCLLSAVFSFAKNGGPLEGYITDISLGGMRLRSDKDFRSKDLIKVEFSLSELDHSVQGTVRWIDEKIFGVQFSHPVDQSFERNIFTFVNSP